MQRQNFILTLFLILFAGSAFSQQSAFVRAESVDKLGHVVSDVLIIISYQETISGKLVEKTINGTTNDVGIFETQIFFEENSTPSNYIFIQAYHPFWSSARQRLRVLSEDGQDEVNYLLSLPMEFETFRVRVSTNQSVPMSSVDVQMLSPFFVSKKTGSGGIAQFRFPKGSTPSGWVAYNNEYKQFEFIQNNETVNQVNVFYPFDPPTLVEPFSNYSLNIHTFDSASNALVSQQFTIHSNYSTSSYLSDSHGGLYISDIPFENITLSWFSYGYNYSRQISLSAPVPEKLFSEPLLRIHEPKITHLGESCYRVEVNITDPREGVLKQVIAKSVDSNQSIAITLEQNQTFNQSQLIFNRIFCVAEDTTFDIVASSPYENTTLTIKLLRNQELPPAPPADLPTGVSDEGIPDFIRQKADEQKKTEITVILVELLIFLLIAYAGLRFHPQAMYYLQSITRFLHALIQPFLKKKQDD